MNLLLDEEYREVGYGHDQYYLVPAEDANRSIQHISRILGMKVDINSYRVIDRYSVIYLAYM